MEKETSNEEDDEESSDVSVANDEDSDDAAAPVSMFARTTLNNTRQRTDSLYILRQIAETAAIQTLPFMNM
jgi:hypothetical protein